MQPEPTQPTQPAQAAPTAEPPRDAEAAAGDAPLPLVLDRFRAFALKANRGLFASLEGATLLERRPGLLKLAAAGGFHQKRLQDHIAECNAVCSDFFGTDTRLEISTRADAEAGDVAAPTPKHRDDERRKRQEALNHPVVNTALEVLQAEIVEIRPLGRNAPSE